MSTISSSFDSMFHTPQHVEGGMIIESPSPVDNDTSDILISDDALSTISRQRAESMRRREVVGQIMQERLAQVQELQQEFLNAQKEYFDINSEIRENDIEIKRLQLQEGCVVGEETEQAVGIPVGAVTLPPNTIPDLSTYLSKSRAATTVRRGRALKDSISVSSDVSSTWEQAS